MIHRLMVLVVLVAGITLGATQRGGAETGTASEFVGSLGAQAISMLQDEALTLEQREARFRDLLQQGFDLGLIGRFVLGRYWKQATADQREDYLDAFGAFIVKKYSTLLGGYSGENFVVVSEISQGEKDMIVRTKIERPSGGPIVADWRVRVREGQWRIIDVAVEGISMAITQRSEFKSVVQKSGIEGLIQVLAARGSKLGAVASNS